MARITDLLGSRKASPLEVWRLAAVGEGAAVEDDGEVGESVGRGELGAPVVGMGGEAGEELVGA